MNHSKKSYFLYNLKNKLIKKDNIIPENFTGRVFSIHSAYSFYYLNGKYHSYDDKPAIEKPGTCIKYWYKNGILHRENDKPSIENYNGEKHYFINDMLHRINGPALEFSDGRKEYYIKGIEITEKEHKLYVDLLKLKKLI